MNFGEWIAKVIEGDRPGAALVISGPQGSGKSTLTRGILCGANLATFEVWGESDPARAFVSTSDVAVLREDSMPAALVKQWVTSDSQEVSVKGQPSRIEATPLAVIVETLDPEQYTGRRFVHIRLGEDV